MQQPLTEKRTAELRWSEAPTGPADVEGGFDRPLALVGDLRINIVGDEGELLVSLAVPLTGPPETLDEQLDAALTGAGWERISEVNSGPYGDAAGGECQVRRSRAS